MTNIVKADGREFETTLSEDVYCVEIDVKTQSINEYTYDEFLNRYDFLEGFITLNKASAEALNSDSYQVLLSKEKVIEKLEDYCEYEESTDKTAYVLTEWYINDYHY